jgi:hypothetical protein
MTELDFITCACLKGMDIAKDKAQQAGVPEQRINYWISELEKAVIV